MRDIGILVWVVLLIVGVIGSMVSTVRKQAQSPQAATRRRTTTVYAGSTPGALAQLPEWAQQAVAQARATAAPVQPPKPAQMAPAPAPKPAPRPAEPPREPAHLGGEPLRRQGARLFAGKREIVRAVITAEVLGKPRAFSDEYHGY